MDPRSPRQKRMLLVASAVLTAGLAPAACTDDQKVSSGFYDCDCGVLEPDAVSGTGFYPTDGSVIAFDAAQPDADLADAADAADADTEDGNADP